APDVPTDEAPDAKKQDEEVLDFGSDPWYTQMSWPQRVARIAHITRQDQHRFTPWLHQVEQDLLARRRGDYAQVMRHFVRGTRSMDGEVVHTYINGASVFAEQDQEEDRSFVLSKEHEGGPPLVFRPESPQSRQKRRMKEYCHETLDPTHTDAPAAAGASPP
ncbi:unnamed protein product, partial [Amoebophrya sp. A25]